MAKFEGTVGAANQDSDKQSSGANESAFGRESTNLWAPGDHADKLHLVASRPGQEVEVDTKFGRTKAAIADAVVVFESDNVSWTVFKQVRVFPVALRQAVLKGGVVGGPILKDQTKSGNTMWVFGDMSATENELLNKWVVEHLVKAEGDGPYDVPIETGGAMSDSAGDSADSDMGDPGPNDPGPPDDGLDDGPF